MFIYCLLPDRGHAWSTASDGFYTETYGHFLCSRHSAPSVRSMMNARHCGRAHGPAQPRGGLYCLFTPAFISGGAGGLSQLRSCPLLSLALAEFCPGKRGGLGDLGGGFRARDPTGSARPCTLEAGAREGSGTSAPCSAALAPRPSPRPRPCPFGLLRAHCARAPPGPALSGHGAAGTGKPRLDGSETGDPRVAAVRSPGHSGGPLGCGEALPSGARVPM